MSLHEGPLDDPILADDEDEAFWAWYYDEDAGGMRLPFPKYQGQFMHSVDVPYLIFCWQNTRRADFKQAFEKYHAGLQGLVEADRYRYEQFRVPFGKKHRGKPLRKCRDQDWLRWCSTKRVLLDKHPLFFRAVERWLANPQKFEHTRDIGELLAASEYADGLDLNASDSEDTEYDLSHEFDDEDADGNLAGFVVADSHQESEDAGADILDELDARADQVDKNLKRKRNKSTQRRRSTVKNANLAKRPAEDDAESSDSGSGDTPARKKPTRKPARAKKPKPRNPASTKKSKPKRKRPTSDSEGIVADSEDFDGAGTYVPSRSPSPERGTRASRSRRQPPAARSEQTPPQDLGCPFCPENDDNDDDDTPLPELMEKRCASFRELQTNMHRPSTPTNARGAAEEEVLVNPSTPVRSRERLPVQSSMKRRMKGKSK